MEINHFNELHEAVHKRPTKRVIAVNGVDSNTLEALNKAVEMGMVTAILTGDKGKIEKTCSEMHIDMRNYEVFHTTEEHAATEKAVQLIHEGHADMIMKGLVPTDKFMNALLKKEYGLVQSQSILSHVALMESPNYPKFLFFSDAGVIPYPDLLQKIQIIKYLIQTAHYFGIVIPKVAVIAPTEQVLISIPSCLDGAIIAKMAERGQIEGGLVDGPMALDVAINRESAVIKGFSSPIVGEADCLLFPNIDAANVFYKTNSKLGNAQMAGIIAGAKVPAIVSSRGDSEITKFNSIAFASLIS